MSLWLNDHPKKRKAIMTMILIAFVFQIAVVPQLAFAQLLTTDPPSMAQRALQWLKEGYTYVVEKGLKVAAWKAFQTAVQRFLGRIAYETAVWIGSGDKGKKPLLYTKGWKQYIEDAGDAAAGDFIETLADQWSGQADRKKKQKEIKDSLAFIDEQWNNRNCGSVDPYSPAYKEPRRPTNADATAGVDKDGKGILDNIETRCSSLAEVRNFQQKKLSEVNTDIARTAPFLAAICTPPDGIQLQIALGLGTSSRPSQPKCTFSQMRENWEEAVEDPAFLNRFSVSFNPAQSDLGIALDLQSNLLIEQDKRRLNETLTRTADGAFKSVTSGVSGTIQTPARMVDDLARKATDKAFDASTAQPPPGLLEGVATIFTNTLVSSLADRMKKGFWSLRETSEKKRSPNLGGLGGRGGTNEVEQVFSSLKAVALQPNTNFDVVSQFQQCPAELKQQLSPYACVLDASFADAIRGGARGPMTVREAMDEGLLHGEWNFGYEDPPQGREPGFNAGYAYSSMVKLRRFRILPVGWEFAAEYIRTQNQPYKLQQVVDCYEDIDKPNDSTLPAACQDSTKKNPFWHLVDPNWILKSPQTNCRAWGPGQQVHKDTGQRLEYCADAQDCVVENEKGSCTTWGYCTKEKNVWRFSGDKCDAQYDTCLSVSNEDTGDELTALRNSWDRTGCDSRTSGCASHAVRTYDTAKKEWINATTGGVAREERFLTKQAATCSERAVGCRAFIRPTNGVNLVPNGAFEVGIEGELPKGWGPTGLTAFTKSLPIAQRGQATTIAKDFAGFLKAMGQQEIAKTQVTGVLSDRTYTVGAWAYIKTTPSNFGNIGIRLTRQQGGSDVAFASALLDTKKLNAWQEVRFGASTDSGDVLYPKVLLVADAGAEVFWDDIVVVEGSGGGVRPYGEGGMTYLRWTDDTKKALACTKDEVGCALYKSESGDPDRAGILAPQDFCPNQCVGYARFTEQAPKNLFDTQRDVTMIPSTATQCRAEDVGCDEFTNLDDVAKGGEGLTYFTEIRQCQKPAPASSDCAPFYTYEGSASSGAQLQSYSLKAAGAGNPTTTDGSGDCLRVDPSDSRYNPNCRDFINAQGKHSFRDITKTITCSNTCYPFRKTNSNQQQCNATNGTWDGNACIYDVIPSEGKQCTKQANGCRAYVGNTGHVLKTVAREDFERGKDAWTTAGTVDTESSRPGGHSLTVGAQATARWTLNPGVLKDGAQYTVAFLVKKQNPDPTSSLTITLEAQGAGAAQTLTRTVTASGWHDETLGPITVAQRNDAIWRLTFNGSSGFYLDDVLIRRTNDQYYRIKGSWNTPAACTSSAVGCQAYRDAKGAGVTFSTMSKSCAFEKVGCDVYIDTQNSTSPFSEVWNLGGDKQCVGGTTQGKVCQADTDCGGSGACRDRDVVETAEDKLTYLINRADYACTAEERGCAAFETKAIGSSGKLESKTAFLRDDPDTYGSALCSTSSEGCATYTGEGGSYYLRDPKENVCDYRQVPGTRDYGWFKKGTSSATPNCPVNGAKLCPPLQSGCTKYIDPMDVSTLAPNGYAYYAIKNQNLDTGSCGTTVDRRRGCVLMQDTSIPTATYKAALTPDGSSAPASACTNPNGAPATSPNAAAQPLCDANVIMKVTHDRTCGEWIYCKSSVYQRDGATGEYREICTELGRCSEANPDRPTECKTPGQAQQIPLTRDFYQADASHVGWGGLEFTGYSIPNIYPVETLQQITRSPTKLTYVANRGGQCNTDAECAQYGGNLCLSGECYENMGIDGSKETAAKKDKECRLYPDTTSPLPSSVADKWIETHPLKTEPPTTIYTQWFNGGAKKGETDYYTFLDTKKPGFTYAEVCQKGEDCECSYKKVLYANGETRYYGEKAAPPYKLMQYEPDDDDHNNDTLTTFKKNKEDTYLGWRGYCLEQDPNPKSTLYQGASTKPCFTWWPLDALQGEVGLFSNHPEAGYQAASETGELYCLRSQLRERRLRYYAGKEGSGCTSKCVLISCAPGYTRERSGSYKSALGTVRRYDCVPVGGDGFYSYDGNTVGNESAPEEVCTEIVQVEKGGENRAQTNRIVNTKSNYAPDYKVPDLGYEQKTAQAPYGHATRAGDPTTWGGEPVSVPSVGGSPYGCFGTSTTASGKTEYTCGTKSVAKLNTATTANDTSSLSESVGRLRQLFAEAYGIYTSTVNGSGVTKCYGWCSTAPIQCLEDKNCAVDVDENNKSLGIRYSCESDTCQGGLASGNTCAALSDCLDATTGQPNQTLCEASGFCVQDASRVKNPGAVCKPQGRCAVNPNNNGTCDAASKKCVGGPRAGGACTDTNDCTVTNGACVNNICDGGPLTGVFCDTPSDCTVDQANGTCSSDTSSTRKACKNSVSGQSGELSGKTCAIFDDCDNDPAKAKCAASVTYDPGASAAKAKCGSGADCTNVGQDCQGTTKDAYTFNPGSPGLWKVSGGDLPVIAAVIQNKDGRVTEGPRNQVTITGPGGNLVGEKGIFHASLRFYAYNENGNQMPLRGITVQWGDGKVTTLNKVQLQNHKNVCRRHDAFVCAVGNVLTSTSCTIDPVTKTIHEGALCTAYTGDLKKSQPENGQCKRVDQPIKKAESFGDTTEACVDDKDAQTPGYFVINHDYTKPGTYSNVSVTVEDNWGLKKPAYFNGTITVKPAP